MGGSGGSVFRCSGYYAQTGLEFDLRFKAKKSFEKDHIWNWTTFLVTKSHFFFRPKITEIIHFLSDQIWVKIDVQNPFTYREGVIIPRRFGAELSFLFFCKIAFDIRNSSLGKDPIS